MVHHAAVPANARQLFYQTWPGWTFGTYRAFDLPAEDFYLADLISWSATFTGHLEGAEAIYNGARGNLVGIRTRLGNTPQHGVLFGMTGAGKSVIIADLLAQIGHRFGFRLIVEEGFVPRSSYAGARLRTSDHQSVGRFSAKATMSGGLALSGQLRPVKGVLTISLGANRRHRQALIVPIAQKISLVRTRSQCDTGVIQDEFIRRYSMALERGVFVCGEGVSPSIFGMKGPFDFILSHEGLRERSNPLIPQEQRP